MSIQNVAPIQRLAYGLDECEVATSVSKSTFRRLINSGQLQTVKIGGRRLVPAAELERLCGAALDTGGYDAAVSGTADALINAVPAVAAG